MVSKLRTELSFFRKQPHNFRTLILTNMVYALIGPVIDTFVSAYIMRSSNDPTKVVIYQLTIYTGIPLTFLLNGFLLRHFNIRKLFSAGMLLSGVSMLAMMSLKTLSNAGIGGAGLIMGMSFGFYWANRDTLVLDVTDDSNRNYYYGLETFIYTIIAIVMPFAMKRTCTGPISRSSGSHFVSRSRRRSFVCAAALPTLQRKDSSI